jgi:hypothetical protein
LTKYPLKTFKNDFCRTPLKSCASGWFTQR